MNSLNIVFYIDEKVDPKDLYFNDIFIPHRISSDLSDKFKESNIYISVHEKNSHQYDGIENIILRSGIDDLLFWKSLFKETASENIAIIQADSPFFDSKILDEIFTLHSEYLSEFTYSENLPSGFSCEIISDKLIGQLPDLEDETLPLSQVIKKNINQFDVELYYKSPDIRDKRLNFQNSLPREKKIMENIFNINSAIPSYEEIKAIIDDNPKALFIGPSYIEVELTGECSLDCIFCYRKSLKSIHENMTIKSFQSILSNLRELENPYTMALTGSGEPLDHPDFYALTEEALNETLVERLIIETNGIKIDSNFISFFTKHKNKLIVIINNNGFDEKTYRKIHGKDNFELVHKNMLELAEQDPKNDHVYVQVMKINETDTFDNETEQRSYLDKYYDFWEETKIPIILQKQNTYINRIEDRRYSDLSPIKRTACWHLQRDMYILSDGSVAFCKEDIDGEFTQGKIGVDSIQSIIKNQEKSFIEDYKGNLCKNPDCANCDEWYTFNF